MGDLVEPIGQYLRRKREEKRISVEDVTLQTRIQAVFIHAIEEGRFDKIASLVSLKGFVRSYARLLKINEVETLDRLSEFLSSAALNASNASPFAKDGNPAQTLLFPLEVPLPESKPGVTDVMLDMGTVGEKMSTTPPYAQWVGVSVACLVAIFLLTFYAPWENKTSKISMPSPPVPVVRPVPPPVVTILPATGAVASDVPLKKEISDPPPAVTASLKPFVLSLEARESTWVKVLIDGKGAKDVLLQAGQKAAWQADKTFLLTMGNGGGAEVFLDGKGLGFLGKQGEIVRDRLLTRIASEQTAIDNE